MAPGRGQPYYRSNFNDEESTMKLKTLALGLAVAAFASTTHAQGNDYADCNQSRDHALAIDACTRVLDKNPNDARAYHNRGLAFDATGLQDRALEDFDNALRLNKGDFAIWIDRGNVFFAKAQWEKAITDYDEAIRINPRSHIALRNRGLVHSRQGNHDKAVREYDRAIKVNPTYADAFNSRGYSYQVKGNLTKAKSDYCKALKFDRNHDLARRNLNSIGEQNCPN